MVDKEESRRKGLILQAVNPVDGKVCAVQISFERMQLGEVSVMPRSADTSFR